MKRSQSGRQTLQGYEYAAGRFTATNATLVDMIVRVYPTRRIQMQGGPEWIDSDRFDVVAKADPDDGAIRGGQWQEMVQVLLEDRFKLKFHRETKELPVLALLAVKNAPTLQAAKEGEKTGLTPGDHGQMIFSRMTMEGLVNTLANVLHVPVVDRTNMHGYFDFTLEPYKFAPEGADGAALKDGFPDLMVTAVREQLGFKLEKTTAPLDITIIDHAEKPSEN